MLDMSWPDLNVIICHVGRFLYRSLVDWFLLGSSSQTPAIDYVAVIMNLFKTMIHGVIVIELQLLSFRMRIEDRRLL